MIDSTTLRLTFGPSDNPDADEVIFHACFAILGEFVEQELGTKAPSWAPEAMHRGYRVHFQGPEHPKAIDLWLWYRDERPAFEADCDQDYAEDFRQEKLRELIEIRRSLWT